MATKRGFAAMDKDKQRAIAKKGGKASGAGRTAAAKRGGQSSLSKRH